MDTHTKGTLVKTVGWILVGVGVYMVHKGIELEGIIEYKDYIDAEFEVIEE